ncbi:MAG TPA: aminotransferase class IV [Luteimonas sp.]
MDPAAAGHFTTMQLRGGRVQGRDLHLARLVAASRELYGVAPDLEALREGVRRALADSGMEAGDCTLRIRFGADPVDGPGPDCGPGTDGGGVVDCGSGYSRDPLPWKDIAAAAAPAGSGATRLRLGVDIEPPRHPAAAPLRLCTHVGVRDCAGIKHLALGRQLEARRAAREAGFDDALLVTGDGRVAEGTFWNIVFLHGRVLVWPDGPALPGVTQQLLQAAFAGRDGLSVGPVPVAEIRRFTAAWALNSTGIQDIASIDGHRFPGDAAVGADLRVRLAGLPGLPF